MTPAGQRLKEARVAAGFESATSAARANGWNVNTYRSNENGTVPFSMSAAVKYGRAFNVDAKWLYMGAGRREIVNDEEGDMSIPLVAEVSAGVADVFVDLNDVHPAAEIIKLKGRGDRIAARVTGDSMAPRFMPGEKLIFGPPRAPDELVNTEVMAQIAGGPCVVKILRRGANGKWSLFSHNPAHDPIEGADLQWARPYEGMIK